MEALPVRTFWELNEHRYSQGQGLTRSASEPCLSSVFVESRQEQDHAECQDCCASECSCESTRASVESEGLESTESFASPAWADEDEDFQLPPGSWNVATRSSRTTYKSRNGTERLIQREAPPKVASIKKTLVIRRLPLSFEREDLVNLLNAEGYHSEYDFIYLPTDFRKGRKFGYAFVNFQSSQVAARALTHFAGLVVQDSRTAAEWSDAVQGLEELVDKYRNNAVMHASVEDRHKPTLFVQGRSVPLPQPTEPVLPPKGSTPTRGAPTTIVVRGLPTQMTREELLQSCSEEAQSLDFLYLPVDFKTKLSFGYAVLNFTSSAAAELALARMRSGMWTLPVTAEWSESCQGLGTLIQKYKNARVMNEDALASFRPVLVQEGRLVPFSL